MCHKTTCKWCKKVNLDIERVEGCMLQVHRRLQPLNAVNVHRSQCVAYCALRASILHLQATWAGCGQHINYALSGVKEEVG